MLAGAWRWSTLATVVSLAATLWSFMLYGLALGPMPTPLPAILCIVAGWLLVTFVHEVGHAAAALVCGWRVLVFAVRPIGLHLPTRTLAWLPHNREYAGYVASVPRRRKAGTPRRWIGIVAGGPAACVLLSGFALILRETWLRELNAPNLIASNFGLGLAIQATASAIVSLLPFGKSDRALILAAMRRDAEWSMHRPCSWQNTMLAFNVRLRDLPEWLVEAQRAVPHPSEDGERYADGIEIGRLLDYEPPNFAEARARIDAYRARYGGGAWLDSCDVYLAAIGEKDVERAAAMLWQGAADGSEPMLRAADAAVAAARHDAVGMRKQLKAMRAAVRKQSPYRNATFRDIERRIRASCAA